MKASCKYCQIEYEVPDDKLADGATLIECVNCGLPFEVQPPPEPPPPPPRKHRRARTRSYEQGPTPERRWFLRSRDGEDTREVPELTMLQKWIFTGLVTRDWQISIDGETWKPLGKIDELRPFFDFAEEAFDAFTDAAGTALEELESDPTAKVPSSVELDISDLEEIADDEPPKPPRAPTEQGMPPPVPPAEPDPGGDWLLADDEGLFELLHPELAGLEPKPPKPPEEVAAADRQAAAEQEAEDDEVVILDRPRPRAGPRRKLPPTPPGATVSASSEPAARIEGSPRPSRPTPIGSLEDPLPNRPTPPKAPPLRKPPPPERSSATPFVAILALGAAAFAGYWFFLRDGNPERLASTEPPRAQSTTAPPDPAAADQPDHTAPIDPTPDPDLTTDPNPTPEPATDPDTDPDPDPDPTPDPDPPEKPDPDPPEKPDPDPPEKPDPGPSYAELIQKADEHAENLDCKRAVPLYQQALAKNRRSVTAHAGIGYCHIEAEKFASAHDSFRAALRISPNHVDSLLGVAEAYTQQGLTDQAIAAYRTLLEVKPTGYYAKIARRQITELGGTP